MALRVKSCAKYFASAPARSAGTRLPREVQAAAPGIRRWLKNGGFFMGKSSINGGLELGKSSIHGGIIAK